MNSPDAAGPQQAGPFTVEQYEDWSDYPGWASIEDDDSGEPYTFASVDEARAWISARQQSDLAERLAAWEAHEEKARKSRALYAARVAALDAAGVGIAPSERHLLLRPTPSYPRPEPDGRYRVALDGELCPTCGVRGWGNEPGATGREQQS